MSNFNYENMSLLTLKKQKIVLCELNELMLKYSTEKRIAWSLENFPKVHVMSSSFGIQSTILLHLITKIVPNIPIILIDTGYLFPETYKFIDMLVEKWHLNVKIFRSKISPAWQEARYGKLWEQGISGINLYNSINKVKPMNIALKKLSVQTWFSGLRHQQSKGRSILSYVSIQNNIFKVLPIVDWSNNKINEYLKKNNLDYHPLSKSGYVSVGDIHTTMPYQEGMLEEETRFFGLKRECGLHE